MCSMTFMRCVLLLDDLCIEFFLEQREGFAPTSHRCCTTHLDRHGTTNAQSVGIASVSLSTLFSARLPFRHPRHNSTTMSTCNARGRTRTSTPSLFILNLSLRLPYALPNTYPKIASLTAGTCASSMLLAVSRASFTARSSFSTRSAMAIFCGAGMAPLYFTVFQ